MDICSRAQCEVGKQFYPPAGDVLFPGLLSSPNVTVFISCTPVASSPARL